MTPVSAPAAAVTTQVIRRFGGCAVSDTYGFSGLRNSKYCNRLDPAWPFPSVIGVVAKLRIAAPSDKVPQLLKVYFDEAGIDEMTVVGVLKVKRSQEYHSEHLPPPPH
ncbi:hypothetical protein ACFV1L_30270 [Kitasatospora sp. NPDC059646]|uniref:hypothetical protein n=1 Tax=Kitasatospora sp. NPDC059646 TaxID=3346893 RepID=UPI0036883285